MLDLKLHIEDFNQKIFDKSVEFKSSSLQHSRFGLISGSVLLLLLRGYTRCFIHDLTPYSDKKRELSQDIFKLARSEGNVVTPDDLRRDDCLYGLV